MNWSAFSPTSFIFGLSETFLSYKKVARYCFRKLFGRQIIAIVLIHQNKTVRIICQYVEQAFSLIEFQFVCFTGLLNYLNDLFFFRLSEALVLLSDQRYHLVGLGVSINVFLENEFFGKDRNKQLLFYFYRRYRVKMIYPFDEVQSKTHVL